LNLIKFIYIKLRCESCWYC